MKNEPIPDFDHLFDTYQRLSDAEQKSPEARLHYGSGARLLFRYRNRRCGKRVQNLNILVCLIGCNMMIQQVIMLCSQRLVTKYSSRSGQRLNGKLSAIAAIRPAGHFSQQCDLSCP